jgi:hypothetical protein
MRAGIARRCPGRTTFFPCERDEVGGSMRAMREQLKVKGAALSSQRC